MTSMMALTEADHVRLAALEAIERLGARATAGMIELECQTSLLDAGITPDHTVDAALVRRALSSIAHAGHASASWASEDLDEHGRPRPADERVWSITPAGEDELDWLQSEAGH